MKAPIIGLLILCSAAVYGQFEIFEKYGTIETLAGTGLVTKKGENNWKRSFERKKSTTVELSRPHMAMADDDGNIYIADKDAHAIRVVDPKTSKIETIAGTNEPGDGKDNIAADKCALKQPNGLFVHPDGSYHILDLGNSKIRYVNTKGIITTVVQDQSGISYGRGLWVSVQHDTIIYASGTELKIWVEGLGTRVYADGFLQLGNISKDYMGNLIITDRGAGKVFRLNNKTGKVDHIAGNGLSDDNRNAKNNPKKVSLEGVRAVCPSLDGGLFVACHESHDVWYISKSGKIKKFINGSKDAHGGDGELFSDGKKVSEVRSITLMKNGDLLICEHDGGYIRRVLMHKTDALK